MKLPYNPVIQRIAFQLFVFLLNINERAVHMVVFVISCLSTVVLFMRSRGLIVSFRRKKLVYLFAVSVLLIFFGEIILFLFSCPDRNVGNVWWMSLANGLMCFRSHWRILGENLNVCMRACVCVFLTDRRAVSILGWSQCMHRLSASHIVHWQTWKSHYLQLKNYKFWKLVQA